MDKRVHKLSDWQENIVAGTVLGGSSLVKVKGGKNFFLSMRSKNIEWLAYKTQELAAFYKDRVSHSGNTYRCNSRCDECFVKVYEKYYKEGKRYVCEDNLSPLMDIGLAIWFIDGGSMTGRGARNAYFSTTRFGSTGTEVVHHYFHDILGIPCKIHQHKQRLRVVLTVPGTEMLLKIILHRFPECMVKSFGNSHT